MVMEKGMRSASKQRRINAWAISDSESKAEAEVRVEPSSREPVVRKPTPLAANAFAPVLLPARSMSQSASSSLKRLCNKKTLGDCATVSISTPSRLSKFKANRSPTGLGPHWKSLPAGTTLKSLLCSTGKAVRASQLLTLRPSSSANHQPSASKVGWPKPFTFWPSSSQLPTEQPSPVSDHEAPFARKRKAMDAAIDEPGSAASKVGNSALQTLWG
mmetsp:Transcript_104818/g.281731  ORF Transcript_104818/g.281731 Transcript_104818/m.281731 type:complete len:216 (+) Transcript_104818:863-1510(+)